MRIFIFSFFLIFISMPNALAAIIDETAEDTAAITDRPMRQSVNLNAIQSAFDDADPRETVQRFAYEDSFTYKLRLREYMSTTIVLPEGEDFYGFVLGDQKNFELVPMKAEGMSKQRMFALHAIYPGADTSLTVFGKSGNVYPFYLRCDTTNSPYIPDLVVYIEDAKMSDKMSAQECEECDQRNKPTKQDDELEQDYLDSLPEIDPAHLDFAFATSKGDERLQPLRIFSDGHFTYFQYGEENLNKIATLPVIYLVSPDGYDTPVNNRIEGGTIICEATGDKWTIRSGEDYLCVRRTND